MIRLLLAGIMVLDFSTLLPGPMATLLLAEAGAEVLKIERPERGDDLRHYPFTFGAASVNFALLNRGKRSIAIDLKAPDAKARLTKLIQRADARRPAPAASSTSRCATACSPSNIGRSARARPRAPGPSRAASW